MCVYCACKDDDEEEEIVGGRGNVIQSSVEKVSLEMIAVKCTHS